MLVELRENEILSLEGKGGLSVGANARFLRAFSPSDM